MRTSHQAGGPLTDVVHFKLGSASRLDVTAVVAAGAFGGKISLVYHFSVVYANTTVIHGEELQSGKNSLRRSKS